MANRKNPFNYMYTDIEMAIILNSTVDELVLAAGNDSLPPLISYKEFYGKYVFYISKSTVTLINGLKKMGVTKILELLRDSHKNNFTILLQQNFNRFDLSRYY